MKIKHGEIRQFDKIYSDKIEIDQYQNLYENIRSWFSICVHDTWI